ncbi:hypothetical protein [uncultured Desulfovibrio sp.]|uniref:hypothetical protein n=1 Tax=uncultured Desulfovibrio sp. TaxID=167968 RepID=UPI00261B66B1|nr:hypothetical protein [uncultured Desulfovibrio sp.]
MPDTLSCLLCALCLLALSCCPPQARAEQAPTVTPMTITVQQAQPGQYFPDSASPDDTGLRVGALICRPLAEQVADRKKTAAGLHLSVPLEWLDGYVAARSGKDDVPFRLWQEGGQWTSVLPLRLRDACAADPAALLADRWQTVRESLPRQKLSRPCRDYLAQGENWLPLVLWWDGYQAHAQGRAYLPLELGRMAAQSEQLQTWCGKHPGRSLKAALGQLAAPQDKPASR